MAEGVKIEGLEALRNNLDIFKHKAMELLGNVVFYGCSKIMNDAKLAHGLDAHSQGRYINRTTALTNSIQASNPKITDTNIKGTVVVLMNYAGKVELGSSKSRPYPFLFPAFEKNKAGIIDSVKKMLRTIKWVK